MCQQLVNRTVSTNEVFLIYDDADSEAANKILMLESKQITWCTLDDISGRKIISVFKEYAEVVKKAVIMFSESLTQNELLTFGISMLIRKLSKHNIVTVFLSDTFKGPSIEDDMDLLQLTTVVRSDSDSWLDDLSEALEESVPSFANILTSNKGNVINSLALQGLCIEHMQSDILGILLMTDKLCMQIDLKEFEKYRDRHNEYQTVQVIKDFKKLFSINSEVVIVLNDDVQNSLHTVQDDIAVLTSAVIDTSIALARCDWSVACTTKGKYAKNEQNFLSEIYPRITYALMNKFVESIVQPIFPEYENFVSRIVSYPGKWIDNHSEAVVYIVAAGYFYAGFGETGRCYHCGCILTNILTQKMPLLQHAARFPSCRFVRRNVPEKKIAQAIKHFKDGSEKMKLAKSIRQKYETLDARMDTFRSYQSVNADDNVDIDKLAEAGFYYIGLENTVQCFCCSVRIYGMPSDQSVWGVHCHLSPTCPFVLKEKGKEFIAEQRTAKENTLNSDCTVITFLRKTYDGTKRRKWPKAMFRPCNYYANPS